MADWVQELTSRFNLEITYLPGEENIVADALSRLYESEGIEALSAVTPPEVAIDTPWEPEIREKMTDRQNFKFNQGQLLT